MAKKPGTINEQIAKQDSIIDSVVRREAELQDATTAILQKLARGEDGSPDELAVLFAAGLDNRFAIEREVSRVAGLLKWQLNARTTAERQTLALQLSEARAKRDAELPALQIKLEELIRQLQESADRLNKPVESLEAEQAAVNEALKILRDPKNLPEYRKNRHMALRNQVQMKFRHIESAKAKELNITGRIKLLERAEGYTKKRDKETPMVPLHGELRDFISREEIGLSGSDLRPCQQKCDELRTKLSQELAEVQAVIEADGGRYNAELSQADQECEYWVL
jgi:hypothetical protein